jgi:hypothetical protein
MAAEFIRADGDIAAAMNFRNSRLAEPFEVQVSKREPSKIREKADEEDARAGWAERVVPIGPSCSSRRRRAEGSLLLAGGRVGLRAARASASRRRGRDAWTRFTGRCSPPTCRSCPSRRGGARLGDLVVDSGYRKDEVTEFARDPQRVHMAKGLSTYFGPIAEQKVERAAASWCGTSTRCRARTRSTG